MTYASSGVDVDVEEKAAELLYNAARKTWKNREGRLGEVITPFDDFSGIRAVNVGKLPAGTLMNMGFDGVGTKAEFADLAERYDTLAFDLLAMVCDDAVLRGGEPVLAGSIIDVNTLGQDEKRLVYIRQLTDGYVKAAKAAGVAIVNGEIAQLGNRVGVRKEFSMNWGAALVWFAHKDRLITGHKVKPGDAIVGLQETSLRSNGISLIRKILTTKVGPTWYRKSLRGKKLIDLALQPSTIYSAAIVEMFGGWSKSQPAKVKLHALANVTGGGLPSKLERALRPSGLGAAIADPFTPVELMLHCQKLGNVSDREAYRTWHMGQGMVIVTPEPQKAIEIARSHKIKAKIIGEVTKEKGMTIASQGYFKNNNEILEFP